MSSQLKKRAEIAEKETKHADELVKGMQNQCDDLKQQLKAANEEVNKRSPPHPHYTCICTQFQIKQLTEQSKAAKLAVKQRNKMQKQLDRANDLCTSLRGYREQYRKLAAKVSPH